MDVLFFLRQRTKFIRTLYDEACAPFFERQRKIENGEAPFGPSYAEVDGPPFEEEWAEAETAIRVLGRASVSMLSSSLKLSFETWQREFRIPCAGRKKKAWLWGYPECFGRELQIDWSSCPANTAILEQVALARDRDQHPDWIGSLNVTHAKDSRKKYPTPFFSSGFEKLSLAVDADTQWRLGVNVSVDRDSLFEAIDEVEKLADWLDAQTVVRRT